MAKQKQHVFSARTTEEGLRLLNELKKKLNVSWDELVIDAVCSRYVLDKETMTMPKKVTPTEAKRDETVQPPMQEQPKDTERRDTTKTTPSKKRNGKAK